MSARFRKLATVGLRPPPSWGESRDISMMSWVYIARPSDEDGRGRSSATSDTRQGAPQRFEHQRRRRSDPQSMASQRGVSRSHAGQPSDGRHGGSSAQVSPQRRPSRQEAGDVPPRRGPGRRIVTSRCCPNHSTRCFNAANESEGPGKLIKVSAGLRSTKLWRDAGHQRDRWLVRSTG